MFCISTINVAQSIFLLAAFIVLVRLIVLNIHNRIEIKFIYIYIEDISAEHKLK